MAALGLVDWKTLSALVTMASKLSALNSMPAIPCFTESGNWRFHKPTMKVWQQQFLNLWLHKSFTNCLASCEGSPTRTRPIALSKVAS